MITWSEVFSFLRRYWCWLMMAAIFGGVSSLYLSSSKVNAYKASVLLNEFPYINEQGVLNIANVKVGFPGMHYYLGNPRVNRLLMSEMNRNDVVISSRLNLWHGKAEFLFESNNTLDVGLPSKYIELLNEFIHSEEVNRMNKIEMAINSRKDLPDLDRRVMARLFLEPDTHTLFEYVSLNSIQEVQPKLSLFSFTLLGCLGGFFMAIVAMITRDKF